MSEFDTTMIDALAAADESTCESCSFFRAITCPDENWETKSPTESTCVCFEGVKA